MKSKKSNGLKNLYPYIVIALIFIGVMYFLNFGGKEVHNLTSGQLISEVNKETISSIKITPKSNESIYIIEGTLKSYGKDESFKAKVLEKDLSIVTDYANKLGKKYKTESDPGSSSILYIIVNILPIVIIVITAYFLFGKLASSNKNSMDFGKSKAKLNDGNFQVKFKDVAGLKEEKEEVEELIDFLKNPKRFQKLGARIPKGVLLVGPPGTGKTLLAKAVAGEANVPFYYISGSDFVELFVGVGASRVRDMFKEAKRNAPCLIFIDEIDAVGRQRGTGLGGGHDEREQTLNQLLTEMDGFGANEGIIIIAATNRPDVLDPALLRPGRFDRQVTVSLPDSKERKAILEVHARNKILAKDVNLQNIAERTPGFSGADIENLLNEAALLAVRRNRSDISMDEIDEATDRVLMGPAKTSRKITDKEKKLVSYHEAGHAVIGIKLEDANEVHKITIIPRGVAGGYTMMLPKEEKIGIATESELLASITGLLGGRASEEIFLKEITTGASDDFKKATNIARSMVTEYGMSELGPMQYEQKSEGVFLGRDYGKQKNFSDQVALEIDKATRDIIESCYAKAKKIIKDNEGLVHLLSEALIKNETLTKEQIESIVATNSLDCLNGVTSSEEGLTLTELKARAKELKIKGYSKMNKEELEKAINEEK
ncbi:MAG: ATP-dependent zinc metalloprotease FtsH [Bacilli bacterium]|nr:ATP-dependent zinc metalloprotease FtsH [Bacilli bacterium]